MILDGASLEPVSADVVSRSLPHDSVEGVAEPLLGRQRGRVHVGLDAFADRSTSGAQAWCVCEWQRSEEDPITGFSLCSAVQTVHKRKTEMEVIYWNQ